jgi:iterative type I PKS product template protein
MLNDALLLEIGPHPTMISSIRESNLSDSCLSLGTLKKGKDAWTSISETLAVISNRKVSIEWRKVFEGSQAKVISLPGHPLKGPVFLVPFQEFDQSTRVPEPDSQERRSLTKTGLDLLPWFDLSRSTEDELVFETELDILGPLITGHDVGGTPICPASLFYELAMEAAQILLKPLETQTLVINGMDFVSPLVYVSSSVKRIVSVRVTKCEQRSAASFRFTSISMEGVTELLNCTGKVSIQKLQDNTLRWMKDQALVKRQNNHFSGPGKNFMSSFRTNILYGTIFARVVKYSPEYQTLVELKVADSKLEGIGSFRLPSTSGQKYLTNPIFTDTLLHAAGFIANIAVPSDEVGICSKIESVEMLYRQINYSSSFTVYCSLLEVEGSILADSFASDDSGNIIAIVRGMEFRRLKLAAFQIALSRNTSLAPSQVVPASPPSQLSAILDTPSMINGSLCGPETTVENLDHSMRQSLNCVGSWRLFRPSTRL